MAAPLRQQLIDAAVDMTTSSGWASVTMAKLADRVGVSRQTVYNEVGSKTALAEAMVLDELARFLGIVEKAFDDSPDLLTAIETGVREVLEHARGNALLHAVVSATHGADTELLPLLTTHSDMLLQTAKAVVASRVEPYAAEGGLAVTRAELDAGIDAIVRVVLSHVMAPSGPPAESAAAMAGIAGRVLGL